MMYSRFIAAVVLTLPALAFAQQPAPRAVPATSPEVVAWLDKFEARGREIRSLSANAVHATHKKLLASRETRIGSVHYLAADPAANQPARFAIHFSKLVIDDALREEAVDYVFDGAWLVQREHKSRRFTKRQMVRPGETVDPLQLDGPFPVPLGQKRSDVLARFNVEIVPPADDDPKPIAPGEPTLHLRLTPRADAPNIGAKRFERVEAWFDRKELVPVKVTAVEDGGDVETTVTLSAIKINADSEADLKARFDTAPPAEGWHVEIKPFER